MVLLANRQKMGATCAGRVVGGQTDNSKSNPIPASLHAVVTATQPFQVVMQNRLVLLDLPPNIPRRANSADALRDLVEEHGCWVDRFAFLCPHEEKEKEKEEDTAVGVIAAIELHLENVRDHAVKKLDGMLITMDKVGDIVVAADISDTRPEGSQDITFRIRAVPATVSQSSQLVERCPLEEDDGERIQTLHLPNNVNLTVARSTIGGGTGADPWRGGILLSKLICSCSDIVDDLPTVQELFHTKDVVEYPFWLREIAESSFPCVAIERRHFWSRTWCSRSMPFSTKHRVSASATSNCRPSDCQIHIIGQV